MMISVLARYGNASVDIYMPCSDWILYLQIQKLHMSDPKNTEVFVEKVTEPEGLSLLDTRFIDLDELNYLAKRLDSFETEKETEKFLAIAQAKNFYELKDLINLTFQLSRYTFLPNAGTPAEGGQMTDDGTLFENEDIPAQEFYDGQVFPCHLEDCIAAAQLHYAGKDEYVCLPCDEISIQKAVKRLNAAQTEDCAVRLMDIGIQNPMWFGCFEEILAADGLYEANRTIQLFDDIETRTKWNAMAALTEAKDSQSLRRLIQKQDAVAFIPFVYSPEELGRYWLEHVSEDTLNPVLEEFFQYDRFGEKIIRETGGRFLPDGGYLYPSEEKSLEEILFSSGDEEITEGSKLNAEEKYPVLLGVSSEGTTPLHSIQEVADYICSRGLKEDVLITQEDGTLFLNTFGLYIDRIADMDYREKLLEVLIPMQMELDGTNEIDSMEMEM